MSVGLASPVLGNNRKATYPGYMRVNPIRSGEIVDIVAPASRCRADELRQAVRALREIGLVPRLPKGIFAPSRLFANTDAKRLEFLRRALYAPDSRLVWCVRGGYGSLRLVPGMSRWRKPPHGKIFLGYSDITTLHAFLNQQWGWPTLHGPLLDRFALRQGKSSVERRQLLDLLFGRRAEVEFNGLAALNRAARERSRVRAPIAGGNLTVLVSGLGTPAALDPRRHILFFEDTGERPYRVDRMLEQLNQAGWFRAARAIVFGHFQLSTPADRRPLWGDVIRRFADSVSVPVWSGLPVGHDRRRQLTLPLGVPAELGRGRLVVESGIESA